MRAARRLGALGREVVAVVRTVIRNAITHSLVGEAAQVAFFFFVSLFPLVLILFALTGIVGGDEAFTRIAAAAETAVPDYAWQFVRELIREITDRPRPGMLSLGVLLTLWAASNAIDGLTQGLNVIYDVREGRSFWKRNLLAIAILAAGMLLLVLGATAFVPGLSWLRFIGLEGAWRVARWPLAFLVITATMWLAYRFLPARDQRHAPVETIAGAFAATILWILTTSLFGLYVANFGQYGRMYGAIGAVIVLLIWFYITAFAVLLGAEFAAALEHRHERRAGAGHEATPVAPG